MDINKVKKINNSNYFYYIMNSLNLSDRQKRIFELKLSRGWHFIDIGAEIGVSKDTVYRDFKIIKQKLKAYDETKIKGENLQ